MFRSKADHAVIVEAMQISNEWNGRDRERLLGFISRPGTRNGIGRAAGFKFVSIETAAGNEIGMAGQVIVSHADGALSLFKPDEFSAQYEVVK